MKTWNDMTRREQLFCIYSDAHKDAYGFRPVSDGWQMLHDEQIAEKIEQFGKIACENALIEAEEERRAIKSFEALVARIMHSQNINRTAAIESICLAEGGDKDDNKMLCWAFGLPIDYLN